MSLKIGHIQRHLHVEVPIGPLPVTVTHKASLFGGLFIVVFALAWGGLPVFGMVQHGLPDMAENPANALFFLFPALGVGILLYGLHLLVWRKTVTLDELFVTVEARGIFGAKRWQEPLTAYQGVLSRTRRISTKNSSYTLYLVDLSHPDEKRSVNLYTARSERDWRAKWEAYARWLKRPALQEGEEGLVARRAEDLDKPVAELIREGKLEVDRARLSEGAEGPAARDLAVEVAGERVVVTRRWPQLSLVGALVFILFPLIFVYFGFFHGEAPWPIDWLIGGLGIFFEVLLVAGIVWDRLSRQRLAVGPEAVTVNTAWRLGRSGGETRGRSLAVAEVESVTVARRDKGQRPAVVVAGDRESLSFGRGLSKESLAYLEALILATIEKHHVR
jgi:hypothetical protein